MSCRFRAQPLHICTVVHVMELSVSLFAAWPAGFRMSASGVSSGALTSLQPWGRPMFASDRQAAPVRRACCGALHRPAALRRGNRRGVSWLRSSATSFGMRDPDGCSSSQMSSASPKGTRFCLAALAFRFETLYLARRSYGLHNCNVNPELPAYPSLALPFRPGKQESYAAPRAYAIERPTHGCALVQQGRR